jgi:hypothetical protein
LTTKGAVTIFFENKTHKIKEVRGIKQYLLSLLLG